MTATSIAKLRTLPMVRILPIVLLALMMSGCEAIKTIFEAGIWVGVILVVMVLGVIGFALAKLRSL